jgi:hypothetical protein
MLLSASALPAAFASQVVMSPTTSYQLDRHGTLQIKATGNLYAKVASVAGPGNVEVQLADDSGATADLMHVSAVAIYEAGLGGQMIAWQVSGVNSAIYAKGDGDSAFIDDLGNDHTSVVVDGVGSSVYFDGSGYATAFAAGNPATNNDTLVVNGSFTITTGGFDTFANNSTGPAPTMLKAKNTSIMTKVKCLFSKLHH